SWMAAQHYQSQHLIFLTLDGSVPIGVHASQFRCLSYVQVLSLLDQYLVKAPAILKSVVDDYRAIVAGLLVRPGQSSRASDRRLTPAREHSTTVAQFFQTFVRHWTRGDSASLPQVRGFNYLVPELALDDYYE